MITRRQFAASTPLLAASVLASSGCSSEPASDGYEAVAERTWQLGAGTDLSGAALGRELVRCATLAPSSHNTQCWKFALDANGRSISVLPDPARRCPAVDPDDHHVFVSLGCATENLIQAALAHGLQGNAQFDAAGNAVRVMLEPTRAQTTPLFKAIPLRQCTRGDYDGKALSSEELALLQRAGSSDTVRLLLLTERAAIEQTLEYVIQGNSAQLAVAVQRWMLQPVVLADEVDLGWPGSRALRPMAAYRRSKATTTTSVPVACVAGLAVSTHATTSFSPSRSTRSRGERLRPAAVFEP